MKNIEVVDCINCNVKIFLHDNGNYDQDKYEDLTGLKPHTKLRCEINLVINSRLASINSDLAKIKERVGL